jgi:hypothetical protein
MQGAKACFFGDGNTKITKEGQIVGGFENKIFVTAKNEKRPQMIHSLNPKQDVLPENWDNPLMRAFRLSSETLQLHRLILFLSLYFSCGCE